MYVEKNNIVVPLKGLPQGKNSFHGEADGEFFASFGNTQIKEANCQIGVEVERNGSFIGVKCLVEGSIVAECDRCLEDVIVPIQVDRFLTVKYSSCEEETSDDDDVMIIDQAASEIDLNQFIYDYVCLDIPLQVVHPEGECNPEMINRICKDQAAQEDSSEYSPFSGLKDLLDNKNN